jgi:hypothetical protein
MTDTTKQEPNEEHNVPDTESAIRKFVAGNRTQIAQLDKDIEYHESALAELRAIRENALAARMRLAVRLGLVDPPDAGKERR